MLRIFICLTALLSLLPVAFCRAQADTDTLPNRNQSHELEQATHLWLRSGQMSGLTLSPLRPGSMGAVTASREYGDYHRVQEAQATNLLSMHAEQTSRAGKYLMVRTLFDIQMKYEYDRAWSDVMRTYNSNPFFFGSDIKGQYDHLYFTLQMGIGSVEIGRFTFGMDLFYEVGNMSRLRDPRSKNNVEDYHITPSASFRLHHNHRVAAELRYKHRKEDMPSIKLLGDDTPYYSFYSGMENIESVRGGYTGFQREFINQSYGAGLTYHYRDHRSWETLLSVRYQQGNEKAWDEYKGTPGTYKTTTLDARWLTTYTSPRFLHTLDLGFTSHTGDADKYLQEITTINNTILNTTNKYYTTVLIYHKIYQVETQDISLRYRLFARDGANDYGYYLGVEARYAYADNRNNLPSSTFDASTLQAGVNGGLRLLNKPKARLWIEPGVTYLRALDASLSLADATTLYATEVLIPDMDYYNASYVEAQLGVKYQFPFRVKNLSAQGYFELKGNHLWADNSTSRWGAWLTFGVFAW